jgi:iron complex transport system ATP-binding protein
MSGLPGDVQPTGDRSVPFARHPSSGRAFLWNLLQAGGIIPVPMKKGPALLDFENVTCLRGGKPALDGITFRIARGENAALLGPNGSGKSTLLKLLLRELYPVANGPPYRMRILGKELWNLFDLRRRLGVVTLDLQSMFPPEMTAWEAVVSGFYSAVGLWRNHPVTAGMDRKTREALDLMDVGGLLARPLGEMSTGEARRVMIARALTHRPETLVLDEPTNSLDLRGVRGFRETLRKLVRRGTSLVLVTHALEDLIPEVTRVLLLREGRVFRDGPKREVLSSATLSALYRMPVRLDEAGGVYRVR